MIANFSKSTTTLIFSPHTLKELIPKTHPSLKSIATQNQKSILLWWFGSAFKVFPTWTTIFISNGLYANRNILNEHWIKKFNPCGSSKLNNGTHSWYIAIPHAYSPWHHAWSYHQQLHVLEHVSMRNLMVFTNLNFQEPYTHFLILLMFKNW